jgi:tRNA(Ile)-lysidine synthase
MTNFSPDPALLVRFSGELDSLVAADLKLGIAVSGGPDSVALLLLTAAARPGKIEAATVDHVLRPESRAEAEMVANICKQFGIPHAILTAEWEQKPESALQERARTERYRLLGLWAKERGISALLTAHHADDQVETLVMRLNRGSGVRGLAGMRAARRLGDIHLVRPLLSWRRSELECICQAAGIQSVCDPSNENESFERVRVRKALADADWLDTDSIVRSAANLAEAEEAIEWAVDAEWRRSVEESNGEIHYRTNDAPTEIKRRIAGRAIVRLATEGEAELRGPEIDRLREALRAGRTVTIRGVLCSGGEAWRFTKAPARRS